jgi:hypothetical protein
MPCPPTLPRTALLVALAAVLLTACANAPGPISPGPASPDLGSLQLREPLRIEPDAATARLQYGALVARNAVQEQDPFCVFEIDTVRAESQTVSPRQFRVVALSRSIDTIAALPAATSAWQIRRVSFGGDGRPTNIYYKTTFRLRDARDPGNTPVRALTCMSNQNAPGNASRMRHLTLPEIRGALGTWFTLNLEPERL